MIKIKKRTVSEMLREVLGRRSRRATDAGRPT
jgi:hypothetical protein